MHVGKFHLILPCEWLCAFSCSTASLSRTGQLIDLTSLAAAHFAEAEKGLFSMATGAQSLLQRMCTFPFQARMQFLPTMSYGQ
jgi:hypothetical protein